ncbi:hypothetical protein BC834DRAFT_897601 [Gloeopeniophorella convolvens]|nr:hypothetical protein BC834DRAFT_897601 [Gloeopeniophorella convolvens]
MQRGANPKRRRCEYETADGGPPGSARAQNGYMHGRACAQNVCARRKRAGVPAQRSGSTVSIDLGVIARLGGPLLCEDDGGAFPGSIRSGWVQGAREACAHAGATAAWLSEVLGCPGEALSTGYCMQDPNIRGRRGAVPGCRYVVGRHRTVGEALPGAALPRTGVRKARRRAAAR